MNTQSEQEDKALMEKLRLGDTSALDQLYEKHRPKIDSFVRGKLLGVPDIDACDIVQDVFRRVQQKARLYKPTGKVLSWMRAIAANIVKDIVKQHFSRRWRDTNYVMAKPVQGGELEARQSPEWEIGDSPNETGGLCGKDEPIYAGDGREACVDKAELGDFYVLQREDGGSNLVWIRTFPMRRAKWGKRDRVRDFMQGYGRDNVPGMFSYYGLSPQNNKKS